MGLRAFITPASGMTKKEHRNKKGKYARKNKSVEHIRKRQKFTLFFYLCRTTLDSRFQSQSCSAGKKGVAYITKTEGDKLTGRDRGESHWRRAEEERRRRTDRGKFIGKQTREGRKKTEDRGGSDIRGESE